MCLRLSHIALCIFCLVVLSCGRSERSNKEQIELAVKATLDAMPTPAPQVVEVTRIVEVTRVGEIAPEPPTVAVLAPTATDTPASQESGDQNREVDTTAASGATGTEPVANGCPDTSSRQYNLIPMVSTDTNHPDNLHGDLNLLLRGYEPTDAPLELTDLGSVTPNAPQLSDLFTDGRRPAFTSAFRVYDWDWGCGDHGCPSNLLNQNEVSLLGLASEPGEEIRPPGRNSEIHNGGFVATVLYAEPTRITLSYARDGTVASDFTIHLENICVDPNLVSLYQAANANGRGELPGLMNGETLGVAAGNEMLVAVRDRGTFLDPRSRGDWWQNF